MSTTNKEVLETVVRMKDETTKTLNKIEKEFDNLKEKIKTVPNATDKAEQGIGKLTGSMFNLQNALKFFTITKFLSIAKDITAFALNASSNMTELENVTTQVFGNMSKEVENFAKQAGAEMGRSVYDMQKYVSDMGAVLKGLGGLDTNQIKSMSEDLASLSVDIGSFKNIDDAQAFNALRGGIVGETEALKTLGIVINDTVMKEYALKQGIKGTWETLDATTKAQLRYQAIMEKTSFMQGDAARTIDSYANQLKVFQANMGNLAVTIGDKLVPTANKWLKSLNNLISATNSFLSKKSGFDFAKEYADEYTELKKLISEYKVLEESTSKTTEDRKRMSAIVDELKSKYPEEFKNINNLTASYLELSEALNTVTDSLKAKMTASITDYYTEKVAEQNKKMMDNLSSNAQRIEDTMLKLQKRLPEIDLSKFIDLKEIKESIDKGLSKSDVMEKLRPLIEQLAEEPAKLDYLNNSLDIVISNMESSKKIVDTSKKKLDDISKQSKIAMQFSLDAADGMAKLQSDLSEQNAELNRKLEENTRMTKSEVAKSTGKLVTTITDKTKDTTDTVVGNSIDLTEKEMVEIIKTGGMIESFLNGVSTTFKKMENGQIAKTTKTPTVDFDDDFRLITSKESTKIYSLEDFTKEIKSTFNFKKPPTITKGNSKDKNKKDKTQEQLTSEDLKVKFGEEYTKAIEYWQKLKSELTASIEKETTGLSKLKGKALINKKSKINSLENKLKNVDVKIKELTETKVDTLNELVAEFNIKIAQQDLKTSDISDIETQLEIAKKNLNENIIEYILRIKEDLKKNNLKLNGFDNVNNLNSLGEFVKNIETDKLSPEQKKYFENLFNFYKKSNSDLKTLENKKKDLAKKNEEDLEKEKKRNIEIATTSMNIINQFLNELANLFPENKELQEATKKVAGFLGDMGNLGLGIGRAVAGDPQGIQQAIQGGLSLIFKVVGSIIDATKDFSKEVEENFKKRSELDKNIADFNNLKNAIRDLTDTIIESTSKLSTDINIAANKEIFKELNKVYAQKGINQDVAVNGAFLRQSGVPDGIGRVLLGFLTLGLSEFIPLKKKEFEKTYKLEDFIDLKGKKSKDLKKLYNNTSEKDLEKLIYKKTSNEVIDENNWNGVAKVELTNFKSNAKELKEKWLEYIKQIEEQEKQVEEFNKNVIKESLDGISVVDVNKEKKQILGYYKNIINDEKEYNRVLPDLEKKVEELLKSKTEIVSAFNDVRINTIQQLSSGNDVLSSLTNGMQSYFNKIRNNIAKIQLESKNGIFQGLDEEMNSKFSEIANELVKIRLEGKNLSDLKIDFSSQFAKMKQLNKINNETLEVVKKLREQAINQGIEKSLVDQMLPLGEAQKRALDISNIMKTAMTASLETNSFNQFSMSLGDSLYKYVKESLIQAFTDSEKYQKLIKKYVVTEDFDKEIDKADSLRGAYDIIKNQLTKAEDMLKAQGLDFRGTNTNTGEYLGGSLQNKIGMSNNFGTLATSGFTVNVNTTITNNGFLSVDDLTNSLIDKTKTKLNFDKQREV